MNTRGTFFALALVALLPAGAHALPEAGTSNRELASQSASADRRAMPEPTTIALMAIGLVGLGIARRRSAS